MSAGDWKELYKAVAEGGFALVQLHTKNGVNLNYQHPEILVTVLVTAIRCGHSEMALYLIENGADPKLESYFDQLTPLEAALKYKNKAVLDKLNEMGVRPSLFKKLFIRLKTHLAPEH